MTKHMKICFKMLKTMHRIYAKYMKICFKMILDFNVSLKVKFFNVNPHLTQETERSWRNV